MEGTTMKQRRFITLALALLLALSALGPGVLADAPTGQGVDVVVSYEDVNGVLLATDVATFYPGVNEYSAIDSFVPAGYSLLGERTVSVTMQSNGQMVPGRVVFLYEKQGGQPAPAVQQPQQPVPQPGYTPLYEGQTVSFGRYEQDRNQANGPEPIDWQVLEVRGDLVLLLSVKNLETRPYHNRNEAVTWETSDARAWLNNEFIYKAFTPEEMAFIQLSHLSTPDNRVTGTYGGSDTQDYVFLLDINEVEYYFPNSTPRKAVNTRHANLQGAVNKYNFGTWWLRSSGSYEKNAAIVNGDGIIGYKGYYMRDKTYVYRPAMWVSMSAFSY